MDKELRDLIIVIATTHEIPIRVLTDLVDKTIKATTDDLMSVFNNEQYLLDHNPYRQKKTLA